MYASPISPDGAVRSVAIGRCRKKGFFISPEEISQTNF